MKLFWRLCIMRFYVYHPVRQAFVSWLCIFQRLCVNEFNKITARKNIMNDEGFRSSTCWLSHLCTSLWRIGYHEKYLYTRLKKRTVGYAHRCYFNDASNPCWSTAVWQYISSIDGMMHLWLVTALFNMQWNLPRHIFLSGKGSYHQWPLLLTWFNFNPSMDK